MYGFMTDAGIVAKRKLTSFGELITRMGTSDANSWALMLCNLAYTPAFQWYIKNIPFNETYYERQLDIDMGEDTTKKAKSEFWNGFKTILDTNEAFKEIGLGIPDITVKQTTAGEKKSMNSLVRQPWQDPDPRVSCIRSTSSRRLAVITITSRFAVCWITMWTAPESVLHRFLAQTVIQCSRYLSDYQSIIPNLSMLRSLLTSTR